MATYKGIQGYSVQTLGSDPTASENVGQLWYNTASNTWKLAVSGAGAWASGGAMNSNRRYCSIAGTQTTAVTTGGGPDTAGTFLATETYDGTSWTTSPGTMGSDKHNWGGLGQTGAAAMATGGAGYITLCETWNGSSWSEGNNNLTGRTFNSAAGTTTSAIMASGETPGSPNSLDTETWNGTSWSQQNDINTGGYLTGHGTAANSASAWFIVGGTDRGIQTEVWNGSTWTEVADLSRPSSTTAGMGSAGSSTLGMVFGGRPSFSALTEQWNGTSWTEVADLATARAVLGGCGSSANALASGGKPSAPAISLATEEWNDPVYVIKTVTTS